TLPRARGGRLRRPRWQGGRSSREEREQEVVGGQVLERVEALARGAGVVELRVERRERLPQGEVARGPGRRPGEVPREEPVHGPLADSRQRDEPRAHLVVRERGEPVQVEVAPGEPDGIRGLTAREAEGDELVRLGRRERLAARERVCVDGALAEA